jgi:hypothetical protein
VDETEDLRPMQDPSTAAVRMFGCNRLSVEWVELERDKADAAGCRLGVLSLENAATSGCCGGRLVGDPALVERQSGIAATNAAF